MSPPCGAWAACLCSVPPPSLWPPALCAQGHRGATAAAPWSLCRLWLLSPSAEPGSVGPCASCTLVSHPRQGVYRLPGGLVCLPAVLLPCVCVCVCTCVCVRASVLKEAVTLTLEARGENPSRSLSAPRGSWHSLACRSRTPVSASTSRRLHPLPAYVKFLPDFSHKDTSHWIWDPPEIQDDNVLRSLN